MSEAIPEGRAISAMIVMAALATVGAMAHHPEGAHSGTMGPIVHGAMIVLLMGLAWGFLVFATVRGAGRVLILGGLLAYGVSLFAHIGAATINGFIVPALANPDAPPVSHDLFRFAWYANQALAKIGVYMTGAAYLLWSFDLLRDSTTQSRVVGILGLAAGAIPAALLATGTIGMDVRGAMLVYAIHAAWAVAIGITMIRGRRASS